MWDFWMHLSPRGFEMARPSMGSCLISLMLQCLAERAVPPCKPHGPVPKK